MKQLIVPIAIIVALIAFFVIIDRKDFYSGDDVTVQQETVTGQPPTVTTLKPVGQPAETKPVEVKPTETNPVEAKPVIETKPTKTRPAESVPVAETKPATTKPTETKPVADHPPVTMKESRKNKDKPVAIPVATREEAIRLNENAIAYALSEKGNRAPFLDLYQDNKLETVSFQGIVRAVSTIPDPEKNDYDNCMYTLFVEIDSVLSKISPEMKIASEVIVNVPIMKEKELIQENMFLPGDKVRCICAEYDAMPQAIQEIQLSDDIQSYELQCFYPTWIKKISVFQKGGNRYFAKKEITILPIQILPKDEKALILRKERIQNEITRIEEEIKKHGGSFEKWKEEYKPISEKYQKMASEGFKGWINDSFFAATEGNEATYDTQAYIEGITPYKKYLEKNNIDLIVLRIPSKRDFAVRVLASDEFLENPAWVEHYYECLLNDIEIVDPMPEMWKHRFDFPLFYFFHIPAEGHPFEGTSLIAAKVVSEVLKRYDYSQTDQPITLEDSDYKTNDELYFWPEGNKKFNPEDNIVFKQTNQNRKTIGELAVNTGSPFLFLSNSYFMYPRRSLGASVPGYSAFYLQHIPDWFFQNGIGNPMIRTLITNRDALSNRKAVIMVGHPSFWRGGFPVLPKYLQDMATNISLEKTLDVIDDKLVVSESEGCSFTRDEDGDVHVKLEKDQSFTMEISIPPVDGKNTCMIRLNFEKSSHLAITALSDKKTLIDMFTTASGQNTCADLFIPVSNVATTVFIRCSPRLAVTLFTLKKIELWYY